MNSIELTRKQVTAIADKYSFTATNVEKVIRLCGILDDLNTIESFKGKLALKGGLAINFDVVDREFIVRVQSRDYRPELLFGAQMKHLEHHPVALATLSKKKR